MEIRVIIEDPRGSTVRHHWDKRGKRWVEKPHPRSAEPWPANYGYIPDTRNPADDDDLDVLVLSRDPLDTGANVTVRPVGLLQRPDGDDKILSVLVGDPVFGDISRLEDVPIAEILAIEDWFAPWSDVGKWAGPDVAARRISLARCRADQWKPPV